MDFLCLGLDSVIVAALFYAYKRQNRTLSSVQKAVEFDLNDGKKEPPFVIEYGMIRGKVSPEIHGLSSNYNQQYKGVLRVTEIKEHGVRVRNNVTTETTRLISKNVNFEPFKILKKNLEIKVKNPLDAHYLFENLHLTYENFERNQDSLATKVLTSFIVGEANKGVETTERMLLTNTTLTCYGKIEKIESPISSIWSPSYHYTISPPTSNKQTYIVTTLSKSALISRLKNNTKAIKISLIIFGTLGAGLGVYMAYKYLKVHIENKKREFQLTQARNQRLKLRRERAKNHDNETVVNNNENGAIDESKCVVCLENPREIVLLDCGHVCLCTDCFELLENKKCPICRVVYRTFAPCYIP